MGQSRFQQKPTKDYAMRVFVTGATGFIGSAVTAELIAAGHQVLGMTRSEQGAAALRAAGATPHHASLEDIDAIRQGAAQAEAVIHLAFNHDFSRFAANCEDDRGVVTALAEELVGSDRPMLVTSGTALANTAPGQIATEESVTLGSEQMPRVASEEAVRAAVARGANIGILRLPQVHDPRRQGLITYVAQVAREKGVSAYIGDGANRWPAAHVTDVARLYRLALERGAPGAVYNGVAEEGIPMRAIAQVLGERLGLPVAAITAEQAAEHFGWLAMFAMRDLSASGAWTQAALNWHPTGPDMLSDLARLDLSA
jgi:nucleoside-diphosphate-sugar epimerase